MDGESPFALVKSEYQGLTMTCSPAEAKRRMQELQGFVQQAMVEGVDFGVIPGTREKSLWQSGAQKLCEMYGLAVDFVIEEKSEDWERGFFHYRVKCVLRDRRSNVLVGVGYGSCNSKEKKYAGRWVPEADVGSWFDKTKLRQREGTSWLWKSKVPAGIDIAKLPTEERDGREGSKYTVYGVTMKQFFVPNEDVCDLVNTFLKMACKRSHVHATLAVTRSGGVFGQDLEDLPPEVIGAAAGRRSWEVLEVDVTEETTGSSSPPAASVVTTPSKEPAPKVDLAAKLNEILAALKASTTEEEMRENAKQAGAAFAEGSKERNQYGAAFRAHRDGLVDVKARDAAAEEARDVLQRFWTDKLEACKTQEAVTQLEKETPDNLGRQDAEWIAHAFSERRKAITRAATTAAA